MLSKNLAAKRMDMEMVWMDDLVPSEQKEAVHPLLRRLRESKRRRSVFGGLRPPNTS
ncbi:hypothetical protein [Salisediminibacterium halotolerans]|uniref:hypothetical protein n=1 Tax=Salisediminibacterium halotolerans TaxID=517425 RepID=UPI00131573CB|nr:hypothetical protein [Salisediminibacterium halotolerans]